MKYDRPEAGRVKKRTLLETCYAVTAGDQDAVAFLAAHRFHHRRYADPRLLHQQPVPEHGHRESLPDCSRPDLRSCARLAWISRRQSFVPVTNDRYAWPINGGSQSLLSQNVNRSLNAGESRHI